MSGGSAKMASSSSTAMTVALVSERRSSSGGRDEAAGALGPAVSITGLPLLTGSRHDLSSGHDKQRDRGEHERRHVLVVADLGDRGDQVVDKSDHDRRRERHRDRAELADQGGGEGRDHDGEGQGGV